MKKFFLVIISAIMLTFLFSCSSSPSKPIRVISGVVKEFTPSNQTFSGYSRVIFTDKREFSFGHTPDTPVEVGKEIRIKVYYQVNDFIKDFSIETVKDSINPLPKDSAAPIPEIKTDANGNLELIPGSK